MACFKSSCDSLSSTQNFLRCFGPMWALKYTFVPLNLKPWTLLAWFTLALIFSDGSASAFDDKSLYWTTGTSTWISILSRSGPDIFDMYFSLCCAEHEHVFVGCV